MVFRDGLLWIGGSYHAIECGKHHNCAASGDLDAARGQARCFVHEAEWRGISRKVPGVPQWAVPGETRIFLAHRDGLAPSHGRLFGYFLLHRVEVLSEGTTTTLASPDVEQKLPWRGPKDAGGLTVQVYDAVTGRPLRGAEVRAQAAGAAPGLATPDHLAYQLTLPVLEHQLEVSMPGYRPTVLDGIQVPAGKRRKVAVYLQPGDREVATGAVRKMTCPDNSEIVTHRRIDGKWRRTRERCPTPPKHEEGTLEWSICPGGDLIPVRIYLGGAWQDTGVRCTGDGACKPPSIPVPPDCELFVPHRSCSLRLRPGAVYLVDALCAAIHDRFCEILQQNGLSERYKSARSDGERWKLILDGRKDFVRIATEMSREWRAGSNIPGNLAGRAGHRGELVLFEEPVILAKKPQAGFRGLQRIDGDDLLHQIAQGVQEPTVHVYVPDGGKEAMLSRREIAVRLAEQEKTTLAAVEDLLDTVAELAGEELVKSGHQAVRLPQMGILHAGTGRGTGSPVSREDLERALVARLRKTAAGKPLLSGKSVHRLLDHLAALATDELHARGAFRLPRIGTLRSHGERLDFKPSASLGVAKVRFLP